MELRSQNLHQPLVIGGPCVAESYELLEEVAAFMVPLSRELGFTYVFKASFDKANRTSIDSYRGPGMEQALGWFTQLKDKYKFEVLTDVHETAQIAPVAKVCDWLQIPAFLCRQTDLIVAATESGRKVNIKKGQFLAPEATHHIAKKVRDVCRKRGTPVKLALTERGVSFGYSNYVVDMRSLPIMAKTGAHIIFDLTHSVQLPGESATGGKSGGEPQYAPTLARAAAATGYLDGFFMEIHPRPNNAKSDPATVLSFAQTEILLRQLVPLWRASLGYFEQDQEFWGKR